MFDFPSSPTQGQIFAPAGGPSWSFDNGAWVQLAPDGITEAPVNGEAYARRNAGWVVTTAGAVTSVDWASIINKPSTFPPTLPIAQNGVTNLISDLALKAPLASPALTGIPTAPTADPATNNAQIATTAYVKLHYQAALNSPQLIGTPTAPTAPPGSNNIILANTAFVQTAVAPKANSADPVFTGDPKAPTPAPGDNDTSIATTAFVTAAIAPKANIASPVFTGDPQAPTPATADNDTSIATTAYVKANLAALTYTWGQITGVPAVITTSSIGWTGAAAGISWKAQDAVANQHGHKMTLNGDANGTGIDLFSVDRGGVANFYNHLTYNTSYDGANWRAINPGYAGIMSLASGGITLYSHDTATSGAYQAVSVREIFSISGGGGSGGHSLLNLRTAAANGTVSRIQGWRGTSPRWIIDMGDGSSETGGNVGSNLSIYRHNDGGAVLDACMTINRSNAGVNFTGTVVSAGFVTSGWVVANGPGSQIHSSGGFFSGQNFTGGAAAVLATNQPGNVYMRPNGAGSSAGEVYVTPSGEMVVNSLATAGANGIQLRTTGSESSRAGTTSLLHWTFINNNGGVGGIRTSGTGTIFNTTSDERLKTFTGLYDPATAAAIIKADPVREFTWNSDETQTVCSGWGAQTSHGVHPDLASPPEDENNPNDRWGIDYGKRTPFLWAALSGALDKIAELEARLAALEGAG